MSVTGSSIKHAKLIHQTVIDNQRGNKPGSGSNQETKETPRFVWGVGVEKAGNDDVACALVEEEAGGDEEGEAVVSFVETVGVAERVEDGGEVERVGVVAAEEEAVEEAEGVVDGAVVEAEGVDLVGPVGGVSDALFF